MLFDHSHSFHKGAQDIRRDRLIILDSFSRALGTKYRLSSLRDRCRPRTLTEDFNPRQDALTQGLGTLDNDRTIFYSLNLI